MHTFSQFIKHQVKKFLESRGYSLRQISYPGFFDSIIKKILKENNQLYIVQIGANDGKSFDPIYDYVINYSDQVKAVLLEPVTEYFEEFCSSFRLHIKIAQMYQC